LTMREYHALLQRHKGERSLGDFRTAMVCTVIVNMLRDPKKGKAAKIDDFMPKQKQEQQTAEQMLANVRMHNALRGGTVR